MKSLDFMSNNLQHLQPLHIHNRLYSQYTARESYGPLLLALHCNSYRRDELKHIKHTYVTCSKRFLRN